MTKSDSIRCFRLRERRGMDNKIIKHRDYIGLENLLKYGVETYKRYDRVVTEKMRRISDTQVVFDKIEPYQDTYPELCEKIDGKWVKLTDEQVKQIFNE